MAHGAADGGWLWRCDRARGRGGCNYCLCCRSLRKFRLSCVYHQGFPWTIARMRRIDDSWLAGRPLRRCWWCSGLGCRRRPTLSAPTGWFCIPCIATVSSQIRRAFCCGHSQSWGRCVGEGTAAATMLHTAGSCSTKHHGIIRQRPSWVMLNKNRAMQLSGMHVRSRAMLTVRPSLTTVAIINRSMPRAAELCAKVQAA